MGTIVDSVAFRCMWFKEMLAYFIGLGFLFCESFPSQCHEDDMLPHVRGVHMQSLLYRNSGSPFYHSLGVSP